MKIGELLKNKGENIVAIHKTRTVYDAVKVLFENKIGAVLVQNDDGELVGIVSERDILRESYRRHESLKEIYIKDIMTLDLVVGEPENELTFAKQIMIRNRIRHLPIISDEKLIGILSMRDIMEAEISNIKLENSQLKKIIEKK